MTHLEESPHGALETALRLIADVQVGDEDIPEYQRPALEGVLYFKDRIENMAKAIDLLAGHLSGPGAADTRISIAKLLHDSPA